jgi:hypothetical protein
MILVPGLMKLGSTAVLPMVKDFAKKIAAGKRGVAVLSPSGAAAKKCLIHRVFGPARLDIAITDRFAQPVIPREWF